MPTNEAQGQTTNEPKDSPDFLVFLETAKANPPAREKAMVVWDELIATLDKLIVHKEKQERFLSLFKPEIKPISTDQASSAAVFPADHAYNLFEQLRELDRPWYKRYARRIVGWGGGATIGAGIKWLFENFDPNWLGFGLAALIGYLALDDFYDGGSIGGAAVIGLLVAALLQLPEGKPKRRKPISGTSKRNGDGPHVHNRTTPPGRAAT